MLQVVVLGRTGHRAGQRATSRDYFDLMWFCQHGKTLADIVAAAQEADSTSFTRNRSASSKRKPLP